MGIIKQAKSTVVLTTYIPCVLIIMCLYIAWIGSYDYEDEFTLGCLLVILGMMYACAIYMMASNHPIYGCSVMLATLIIIISIAAVSGFKQKDGSQGSTFICLGVTPMLSGICFASIGAIISYTSLQVGMMTHGVV